MLEVHAPRPEITALGLHASGLVVSSVTVNGAPALRAAPPRLHAAPPARPTTAGPCAHRRGSRLVAGAP